ncbi:MAG: hypothetical protein QN159_06755 [Armatimonadota bacterium]|nr:hypothetical protein [Armatimonadota bacterium]
MAQLRWEALSVANIAVRAVIPAIQASANGRLVAIACRSTIRAQDAAARLRIPRARGSYNALPANLEVGTVYVPLPSLWTGFWARPCSSRAGAWPPSTAG